ncbi:hypothetical protein [Paraburkholderia caffeinilytica]|uniref:Glycosyltransferase RgtA/B/C/D-like domain-containing protein n=1 Tax=Paraburkholderia caffeinilytica TaxID=1761016 RepID=A0ABQ1MFL6_9BURK|nr:hypothetical protein [Paraburkholderia caffeinilytica]GGC39713.1 hypothetical protein GCM10011400_28080 [Paraburkholderia caffeinilytica]CAB3786840.1 hypothetical protein LMG28690_02313 [Paraburkholderia caffeinilytica]
MFRKVLNTGPRFSNGVVRLISGFAILLYMTMYWKASIFLPEFVFRDSDKIQSQIGGSSTYQDTSFDAVAKFYSSLGSVGTNLFVVSVGALFIWLMFGYSKRLGGLLLNTVLIAPCVFFNLFVASKDTIVVLMSIVLILIGRRWGVRNLMVAAVALYVGYALTVRIYFALILAIAVGAWVFRRASLRLKTVLILAVLVGLYMLPDIAYYVLLHPRDMAVDYLVAGSPYGARTGFYNLFAPDSFAAFCADYLYAILKLNVPVLFYPGPKEFLMLVFVWIAVGSVCGRTSDHLEGTGMGAIDVLASLVIGHMAVSMLFEPDLGSYIRHLSSVALFCAWPLNSLGRRSGSLCGSALIHRAPGSSEAPMRTPETRAPRHA